VVASSAAVGLWSAPVPEARSRHQQPSPLETAVALAPRIRAAAAETERQRRLSPELVRALAAGGVFRMCVPRALGGGEVDPATMIETVETLAAADGAAGWSAMIGATSGVASAYLAEEAAQEIYGSDPEVVSGGAFAPLGKATVVDGGYRVSGRWPFASGCEHCAWLMGGSVVLDGGQPRLLPSGMADNRLMLFPAAAVRIIDTWDVAGLRGTGSHDIAVEDQFVPAARSLSLISDRPRASGPLYAFPVFGLLALGIAGVALGIARRSTSWSDWRAARRPPAAAASWPSAPSSRPRSHGRRRRSAPRAPSSWKGWGPHGNARRQPVRSRSGSARACGSRPPTRRSPRRTPSISRTVRAAARRSTR